MNISVMSLLDAGVLLGGRLPDIYWDLELSGSEIKVLRYVYNNCLRLYRTLKVFPRGEDGSPRFWRGKERMADDCGVSYPTFRNNIRHLFELGIVTSMDGDSSCEEPYCIGLTCDFLNSHITKHQTENDLRLNLSFINFLKFIYEETVISFLTEETVNKLKNIPFLFTNVNKKPADTSSLVEFTGVKKAQNKDNILNDSENQEIKPIKRTHIHVFRTPVTIQRVPILVLPEITRIQSAKQKLNMLKNVRTPHDRKLLEICEYYEFKCRQVLHSTGFRAIGKDFRSSKNWKFLDRLNELCEKNEWEYQLYIDSQFDRVHYWKIKQLYPYLNQFFSDNALKYYQKYVKDYQEKNSITGLVKAKASQIKTVKQQVVDDVIKDCESISDWIEKSEKRRNNKGLSREQLKVLYLADHWFGLSVSYLATIPWFLSYLDQFPEETFLVDFKNEIRTIQSNKKLFNLIVNVIQQVESKLDIPATLTL